MAQIDFNLAPDGSLMKGKYLVFLIAGQSYALEISYVIEIVEVLPITLIPGAVSCLKGVINLRGSIIPIIDLSMRFGYAETEFTDRTCIIVIENDGLQFGFIVEQVCEVAMIDDDEISPQSNVSSDAKSEYIKGIGMAKGEVQLLIDCDKVMDVSDII